MSGEEPEEWWSSVCVPGSLRVSSWEDEIQLKRELVVLSGEMWQVEVE